MYEVCRALGINRSAYSYWQKTGFCNEMTRIQFYQQVITVYREFGGIYGANKLQRVLNSRGIACSAAKVSRAMHTLGIRSIVAEKFKPKRSSLSLEERSQIVNLIKNLDITGKNQVWTTDITYIKTVNEVTFT